MRRGDAGPLSWLYWALVVALVGFGAIGIFGIGLPFLVVGFVLAAIHPLRRQPRLFWPPLLAVIAFFAGWWLLGPVSCHASNAAPVECQSLIGITYSGDPVWIGPVVGLAAGAIVYVGTYAGLRRLRPSD